MFYKVNVRKGKSKELSDDISSYESIDEVIVDTKMFSLREICTGYKYDICFRPVLKPNLIPNHDFVFEDELCEANVASLRDVKEYIENFNVEDRSFYNEASFDNDSKAQKNITKQLVKAKYNRK